MARPTKCRRICAEPAYDSFRPEGIPISEQINMTVDEYEVIRLIDLNKCTHEQCAQQMGISRTTVTEIYESARYKLADSVVHGKVLNISGGNYYFCDGNDVFCCKQTCIRISKPIFNNNIHRKDYFVLTTNIDHAFQRAGFSKEHLCYTQGDFGLFQCSKPCHTDTYDNYATLQKMVREEKNMSVPTELIPHCPRCGREMDFNLFWDDTFIRDKGWHIAHKRYTDYIEQHKNGKVLYLELGVGFNSPGVIKIPFWNMAAENPDAVFASVNLTLPCYPEILEHRSIVIQDDIDHVIENMI